MMLILLGCQDLFDKIPASNTQLSAVLQKVRGKFGSVDANGNDQLNILAINGTLEWTLDKYSGTAPFPAGQQAIGIYSGTPVILLDLSITGVTDLKVEEKKATLILKDSNGAATVLTFVGDGVQDGLVGNYAGTWQK